MAPPIWVLRMMLFNQHHRAEGKKNACDQEKQVLKVFPFFLVQSMQIVLNGLQ